MSRIEDNSEAEAVQNICELVLLMARSLVDDPGAVAVTPAPVDGGTSLHLVVAAEDQGKVIGGQGRTARSFRTILSAAGMRCKHRFVLDIGQSGRS